MKLDRVLLFIGLLVVAILAPLYYRQYVNSEAPEQVRIPGDEAGAPVEISLDLADLPTRGSSAAKVVLVEFSDYECPFCLRHAKEVAPELNRAFVETGRLRYAFANNPLDFHPSARLLATSAICAGDQGSFWQMHERLFAEKARTKTEVLSIVQALKLDSAVFEQCLENSPAAAKRIAADMRKAGELQMSGTPGFAVGIVDADGRMKVSRIIIGAQPIGVFVRVLEAVLNRGNHPAL